MEGKVQLEITYCVLDSTTLPPRGWRMNFSGPMDLMQQ
ncbi:MAG: hypothetical protein CM1200mP15_23170 [Dehalococcoidia bacterium]|nr:MAG: hypothetical protein CM1200mP15_23170 [Dehalococcoidia bacterium]